MPPTASVVNNRAAERFELHGPEGVAFAAYSRLGPRLFLAYTEVPGGEADVESAGTLMRGVFEYARERGLTVVPICPVAKGFVEAEPAYAELVRERDL